jgi:ABC-type branched-subunit amino acid transport system substrate-binding protein
MQSLVIPEAFPKLPDSTEGLAFIGTYPRDLSGALDTPANRAFQARHKAVAGDEPVGLNTFEAYVSTNALIKAIEKSGFKGRVDTDKLIAALETLDVPASVDFPAGPLTIRKSDHQGITPLYIAVIKGGKEQVQSTISAGEIAKIN